MEKFIQENPGYALWLLTGLVTLVVWFWKRDINKANESLKIVINNNTNAWHDLAVSFTKLEARVRHTEEDIAETKSDIKNNRLLCIQHIKLCPAMRLNNYKKE